MSMSVYNSALAHDARPIQLVDTSKITVQFDGVPQTITGWSVVGQTAVHLTLAADADNDNVVTLSATRGWCEDSSDIGFISDVIGHQINAKCWPPTSSVVTNNAGEGMIPDYASRKFGSVSGGHFR
jgi:hypothetical protein